LIEQQDPLTTQFGTLKVVAGNISVHSRNAMGLDADVDIDLDSNTGERILAAGGRKARQRQHEQCHHQRDGGPPARQPCPVVDVLAFIALATDPDIR